MPDYLSVSQIQTFLMCPRKYRFRYIDRIAPARRSIAMALGSSVHSAIAWWQSTTDQSTESADAMRVFRADWKAMTVMGDYVEVERPTELQTMGETLVELFVAEFALEPRPDVVDVRFEVALPDLVKGGTLPVPLVGWLDFAGDGCIGEIKTTARKSKASQWGLQLAAYSFAFSVDAGRRPEVELVQLVKTRKPSVHTERLTVTLDQERWFLEIASEVWWAIQNGQFFPSPGWGCDNCEFRGACHRRGALRPPF